MTGAQFLTRFAGVVLVFSGVLVSPYHRSDAAQKGGRDDSISVEHRESAPPVAVASPTHTPIATPAHLPEHGSYKHTSILVYGSKELQENVPVTLRLEDKDGKKIWEKQVLLRAGEGDLQAFRLGEGKTKKLRKSGKLRVSTTNSAITEYDEIDRVNLDNGRFTTTLSLIVPEALTSASQRKGILGSGTFTTPVGVTIVLVPREIDE